MRTDQPYSRKNENDTTPIGIRLNKNNKKEDYGENLFRKSALVFCLLSSLYFGQGALKGFGEIENQETARRAGVPAIEQRYTSYLCLGAKNLAGKVIGSLK